MKPDAATAMRDLIHTVRETIPFGLSEAQMCRDGCNGCSLKLLEYLESELNSWESRLADGKPVGLAEYSTLLKTSKKVYAVLQKNDLLPGS